MEKVQLGPVFSPGTPFSHCLYHSTTAPYSCSLQLLNSTKLIGLHSTFLEMSTDSDRHKLSLNDIHNFLISNFRNVVKVVFSFVWFPGVWILCTDVSEHCSIFIGRVNKEILLVRTTFAEGTDRVFRNVGTPSCSHGLWRCNTQCSETSAHKVQTPGDHPKERVQQCSNSLRFNVDKNPTRCHFCVIVYFSFTSCSTCFGQPCAHLQELTTA